MKLSAKKCRKCGAVIPKKGRSYKVVVRANGRKITKTTSNLELAREIEAKLKINISKGQFDIHKKKPAPILDVLWAKYMPWAKVNKKTWRDDQYRYHKHLQPAFGGKRLDRISPFDVEKLMLAMKKTTTVRGECYAPATIKQVLTLLSRLYSVSVKWGLYAGVNPCQSVRKPKINNQVTEFLTDAELTQLLTVLENYKDPMAASFVSFLLYTGLRRGELFKLTWSDVDLSGQTVKLRDPKGKQDVTLPLSNKAVEVLQAVPREYETQWIFYGRNGGQRTDFKRPWLKIKQEAELPAGFRLHGLRHHFASSLASNGVGLYTIQTLLTHKEPRMTQRYAHLSGKVLRDAINLSDKLQSKTDIIKLKVKDNG